MEPIGKVNEQIADVKNFSSYIPKKHSRVHEALLKTFAALLCKKKQGSCQASHDALLDLLNRFYKANISKRMLCYHLLYLEKRGWMVRYRQYSHDPDGRITSDPTLYYLTWKARKYLQGIHKFARSIQWYLNESGLFFSNRRGTGNTTRSRKEEKQREVLRQQALQLGARAGP